MEETVIDVHKGMRDLADGYIRFRIKAKDTENNQRIHDAFKEFCKVECDNDYTLGLKILLKNYENDYRFDSLHELYELLKDDVEQIKQKIEKKVVEEEQTAF